MYRAVAATIVLALALIQTPLAAAKARNVIIFIADGAGFNAYAAASYYQYGRLGAQVYDGQEWVKYASRTLPLSPFADRRSKTPAEKPNIYDPDSIWDTAAEGDLAAAIAGGIRFKGYEVLKKKPTDSAAAGTAMASGRKTYNGRINLIQNSADTAVVPRGETIAEIAKSLSKSTGVVTSVQWDDATPATFGGAHNLVRGNKRQIANEMLTSGTLDLIMGGGNPEYDANGAPRWPSSESDYDIVGGSFTWELLCSGRHAGGWKLIQRKADFEALQSGPTPARVLGLAQVAGVLQQERQTKDWNRDGVVDDADKRFAPAYGDPFVKNVPNLATMTRAALNVLSRNPKGFYVMIEGGAVDRAAHANQPGRLIEEQIDFNRAVEAAVDWVNTHSDWRQTLIIVSADHETGMLWGTESDSDAFEPIVNRGAGRMPGMWFNATYHTNSLVPLRARGAGANLFASCVEGDDPVWGRYVENTTIFDVAKAALTGEPLRREPTTRPATVKTDDTASSKKSRRAIIGLRTSSGDQGD